MSAASVDQAARSVKKLSRKTVHGVFWASGIQLGRMLTVVKTLILARLLAPAEVGLMGIALTALAFVELSTHTGFRVALIRQKGDIGPYLDTAWTLEVVRGLVLGGIMLALAPLAAAFFRTPEAERVVQALALVVFIRGFTSIGIVHEERELEVHKRFVFKMTFIVVSAVVTMALAFTLRSVWALVYGTLLGMVAQVAVSFRMYPYRPRPRLELSKANDLFQFSKWVFGTSLLTFFAQYVDRLFIGRMLDARSLGFYQLAFRLTRVAGAEFREVAKEIALPVYAKLQDNRDRLRRAYLEGMQLAALLSFPMTVGMIVVAPQLIPALLGNKWAPMVPALQVLAIPGLLASLEAVGSAQLFTAVGRPALATKLQVARLLLLLVIIYPLIAWLGIVGAALALTISSLVVFPVASLIVARTLECPLASHLKVVLLPAASSAIMASALLAVRGRLVGEPTLTGVVWLVMVGVVVYVGAVFAVDLVAGRRVTRALRHRLAPGRSTG